MFYSLFVVFNIFGSGVRCFWSEEGAFSSGRKVGDAGDEGETRTMLKETLKTALRWRPVQR